MKAIVWVMGGFVLLALSRMIEAVGDTGTSPSERLPIYFFALAVMLGAAFCFIKAGRILWDDVTGKNRSGGTGGSGPKGGARPARRLADTLPSNDSDSFDPDAAFTRYMERRGEQTQQAPAPDQPAQPPTLRGFGRKGT